MKQTLTFSCDHFIRFCKELIFKFPKICISLYKITNNRTSHKKNKNNSKNLQTDNHVLDTIHLDFTNFHANHTFCH